MATHPHKAASGSHNHSQQGKMISTAIRPLSTTTPSQSTANRPTTGANWKPPQMSSSKRERDAEESHKSKKAKRKGGKACVYCRRSHMVCEGGRPCERCIKRDIAHLCRDVTPPASSGPGPSGTGVDELSTPIKAEPPSLPQQHMPHISQPQPQAQQLMYDAASSWPLLPDANPGSELDLSAAVTGGGWGGAENAEFGILSDMLKTLRVPTLPGGFVDVLSQVVRNTNGAPATTAPTATTTSSNNNVTAVPPPLPAQELNAVAGPMPTDPNGITGKGKGKSKAEPFSTVSRIEQYLLAAADQPDGSRASRLTQVIRAKYEAGLLKPYDYIKGYERMNRWMDSGRAARLEQNSRATSPTKGGKRIVLPPPPPSGSSISPESRRRILAALEVFRPRFRRIAKELTDLDLVFVEEANERLMLQYDRALASIHTPSCIFRRTGEIQKANQEFAMLTGIPAPLFRNGQLCVYELMDEDSAVRFWEGYGKVAFEKGQSHMYTHCTLKIPLSLTRAQPARTHNNTPAHAPTLALSTVPDLSLPQAMTMVHTPASVPQGTIEEEFRVIKTCFSITIRRDRYDIPVAIMGQWIPIKPA